MKIIDAHCDVLSKMLLNQDLHFIDDSTDVSLPKMQQANMLLQAFAIYLPEKLIPHSFDLILKSIDILHRKILCHPEMQFIRYKEDLLDLQRGNRMGVLLTLEGTDALQADFMHLRILFHLGLRCLGMTWNYGNWAADGVMEPRSGGLTINGRKLVRECNDLGIIVDVSHLSEKAFWDLAELSAKPYIATHSNAFSCCNHPRNLTDDQIKAIIASKGAIGITFVPWFVQFGDTVNTVDLLRHIEHICSLGGVSQIGFGSDFDGMDHKINGLEHTGRYYELLELLCQHYKQEEAEGFIYGNWLRLFMDNLPSSTESP